MNLITIEEIRTLNHEELKIQIITIKKSLFDFRLKKATKQTIQPHIIKAHKKQLAKLMTIEQERFTLHQ